jgi:hypothetical protein
MARQQRQALAAYAIVASNAVGAGLDNYVHDL